MAFAEEMLFIPVFPGESGLTGETPALGAPVWCRVEDGVG